MKVVSEIHQADHWPTADKAWKAGSAFITSGYSGHLGDFDFAAKRHRDGWVMRLETPVSEGRTRIIGYLAEAK